MDEQVLLRSRLFMKKPAQHLVAEVPGSVPRQS
jgi:hypothetical protein